MRNTRHLIVIIVIIFISFLVSNKVGSETKLKKKPIDHSSIDLSTPEKTIFYFYEAFRTGDNKLLSKVLADNALLSEFSPIQTITKPYPGTLEYGIKKIRIIDKATAKNVDEFLAGNVREGDVLVFVELEQKIKLDPQKGYKGSALPILEDRPWFLLIKENNKYLVSLQVSSWEESDLENGGARFLGIKPKNF